MISRKTTVSAVALLLASAGAAVAFPATATTDLNVRSGPGTGYSVVDQLQAGDTVEIVATRGSWYQTAEGGWASGNFLDAAEGGQTSYYGGGGYGYGDYGTAAFYYDDNPYYWDDSAGFYFYIDGGRRHRVGWDWFRDRDHDDFRWTNTRYRHEYETRRGNWDGDRSARRGGDDNDDDGRRFRRSEADVSAGVAVEGENRRFRRSEADVSAGATVEEGRRFRRGDAGVSAGASVEADQPVRSGRASAGREGPPRARAGDQPVETRGGRAGGGGQGGGGAVLPRQGDIPGGGY
jgi:uncharacterized protein YraI